MVLSYCSKSSTQTGLSKRGGSQVPATTDDKRQGLLSLLDRAIAEAEKAVRDGGEQGAAWLAEDATMTKRNLLHLRQRVAADELPPSGGAGLGISRALSEWAPKYLYEA